MKTQTGEAYIAVALGGALGAIARALFVDVWPYTVAGMPLDLLVINILGSGLLAVVLVAGERVFVPTHPRHHLWRPFMATGVLGGFTTTSAFAGVAAELIYFDKPSQALMFVGLSVVLGLIAFHIFHTITLRIVKPRGEI